MLLKWSAIWSTSVTRMNNLTFPLIALSRLRMATDGDGITTLIAGAGCPLDCKWCLNAKLLRDGLVTPVTPQELYDRVKIDDLYFRASGGGVTFGGGESLLHAPFIQAFRSVCNDQWRIYAETSLHVPRENVVIAAQVIDEYIVDIKDLNPEIYHSYTGGDVALARQNLEYLLSCVGPDRITVRIPLIPEFNTSEDQAKTLDKLTAMGITKTDVFPYIIKEPQGGNQ